MTRHKKLIGEERRTWLLQILKETVIPITGSELATKTNVSRQAIVSDMNLLKARNEPIIATRQGYLYLKHIGTVPIFERTITCHHIPEELEKELNLIVDHGVTIKDARINHSEFGCITVSIMISSRVDVRQFIDKLCSTSTSFLSEVAYGFHLLTLSSINEAALTEVEKELKKQGFII